MITLIGLRLRRDRTTLPCWIVGIAVLVAGTCAAVTSEFGDPDQLHELVTLALGTPALLAFRGIPNGFSTGSVIWFQLFTWLALVIGLLNTLLATRHGRAEEADGRRELLARTPPGRLASTLATLAVGVAADVLIGLLTAVALIGVGLDVAGAIAAGATFLVTGVLFLGVGLLAGELMPTARAANAAGVAVVAVAYLLRAGADAVGDADPATGSLRPAWFGLISPIGWGERVLALTDNRAIWLLPGLLLAALTVGAALVVASRRDLGSSLLPERRGRGTAATSLRSSLALAVRQQRSATFAWAIGAAAIGAATGSLAAAIGAAAGGNSAIGRVIAGIAPGDSDQLVTLFTAAIMTMTGIAAAAASVQAVVRFRADETAGRAELLVALPVGRVRWILQSALVGVLSGAVVLAVAGLAAAASFLVRGDQAAAGRVALQAAVELPAAALVSAVAAFVLALLPRWSAPVAWTVLGAAAILALFGRVLSLPSWVVDLSPYTHLPSVPVGSPWSLLVLIALTVVAVGAAGVAARHRELLP